MKIIVPGAAGVQGRSAVVYLLEQKDVTEVLATDIQEGPLQRFAKSLGDRRLATRRLDLTDYDATVEMFKGYDVVVNCALTLGGYTKTTKAAAEAGVHYLDLTTKGEREAQRALDGEYKKKGLVCVQDMGVAPGLTNIMAAYMLKQLDSIDTIEYNMFTHDLVPPDEHTHPLLCPIPLSDLLYLYTKPTFVYEDGVLKEIEPRARPIKFRLDPPIGEQTIAGIAHSEPVCLSKSYADKGIKRVITRTSYGEGLDKKIEFLRDLGFWNQDPIDVKGQKVLPYDLLKALVDRLPPEKKKAPDFIADLVTVVMGEKDGSQVEYRLRAAISPDLHQKMKDKGCSGSYRAGLCAAAAAILIGRGQIQARGVVAPELSIPPEPYFAELSKFGFRMEITRKSLLA
jgi:lysine 6-dehydrogenase